MSDQRRSEDDGMSDDETKEWQHLVESVERGFGRAMTAEEFQHLRHLVGALAAEELQIFRQSLQIMARIEAEQAAEQEEWAKVAAPFIAFMRKLQARQGTVTPDFDAIRRRKAELDRDLLGDDKP
jgi:hypothetical protein